MHPDSIALEDSNVEADVNVSAPDDDLDDDEALMAQAMGFASFGAQHPNKKRRYNPRADAVSVSQPKPSATGANSTALGPAPTVRSNVDEIALDDDDAVDTEAPALAQVRPASLPQRPAAPQGGFATSHQASFQPRRPQDPPPSGPWYDGYYDPSTNENPWERLEKARGLSALGPWLPRGGGAARPSTTGTTT